MLAKHYQVLIIYIYTAFKESVQIDIIYGRNLSASCAAIVVYAADDQFRVD